MLPDHTDIEEIQECPQLSRLDIALYVDGGLSPEESDAAREHIKQCSDCSAEVDIQLGLLKALKITLNEPSSIEPPKDFTKKVVRAAENHVTGVRSSRELLTAAYICLLFLASAAFAVAISGSSIPVVTAYVRPLRAVISVIFQFVYGFALSMAVIIRSFTPDLPLGFWASLLVIGLIPVSYFAGRRLFRNILTGAFGK